MPTFKRRDEELFTNKLATVRTKGRRAQLEEDRFRTESQRDVHRIIYSQAFRRLRHKTQVFFFPRNDHVCTRMEHVLHVAAAARTIARCLGLNEDLAEAIGLAHDIGHAPFGHAGEEIINKKIIHNRKELKDVIPEFSHEVNSLRVVDKIARLDREPPGLNLTWEVRDGIVSHCGEDRTTYKLKPDPKDKVLESIRKRAQAGNPTTLEGCIVRLVDKIVYVGRDLEDAIATKVVPSSSVPKNVTETLGKNNGEMIGTFVKDMIENSADSGEIAISERSAKSLRDLLDFNYEHIYNSEQAKRYKNQAEHMLTSLFNYLVEILDLTDRFAKNDIFKNLQDTFIYKVFHEFVTKEMQEAYTPNDPNSLIVLDFVAGMTDNFALNSYMELFVPQSTV